MLLVEELIFKEAYFFNKQLIEKLPEIILNWTNLFYKSVELTIVISIYIDSTSNVWLKYFNILLKYFNISMFYWHHKPRQVNRTLLVRGFWPKQKQFVSYWHFLSTQLYWTWKKRMAWRFWKDNSTRFTQMEWSNYSYRLMAIK